MVVTRRILARLAGTVLALFLLALIPGAAGEIFIVTAVFSLLLLIFFGVVALIAWRRSSR
jgi:hypothetical protein